MFPKYKFKKTRPIWLKNRKTNKRMELDIYCEELNLAIEYNGEQHYKYNKYFHKNDVSNFEFQCERDELKKEICFLNYITLITVPYTCNNEQSIRNYILNRLPDNLFNCMD